MHYVKQMARQRYNGPEADTSGRGRVEGAQ